MKSCVQCGEANSDTAKRCMRCNTPLAPAAARTCSTGRHIMDPSWTECVYCQQSSGAAATSRPPVPPVPPASGNRRMATMFEAPSDPGYAATEPNRPRTQLEGVAVVSPLPPGVAMPTPPHAAGTARRSETVVLPQSNAGSPPGSQPVPAQDRRIVGILVTYSWERAGRIYPVREGRNFIGRDPECDVYITGDSALSAKNSYITFRRGFVVGDMMANMNGTDLNGQPVDGHEPLPNYAVIRAGTTHFTFIAIDPQALL